MAFIYRHGTNWLKIALVLACMATAILIPHWRDVLRAQFYPGIISIDPSSGPPGTVVTITGFDFGNSPRSVTFFSNSGIAEAEISSWSNNEIEAIVPQLPPGSYLVFVRTISAISNRVPFEITADAPDSDSDGIPDSQDNCLETAPGATVDSNGCSQAQIDLLRDEIDLRLRLQRQLTFPQYLLDPNSFTQAVTVVWLDFTDWVTRVNLTEKYDEFYFAGIDYDFLSSVALIKAGRCLDIGDIPCVHKNLESSKTYKKLSGIAFQAAIRHYQDLIR